MVGYNNDDEYNSDPIDRLERISFAFANMIQRDDRYHLENQCDFAEGEYNPWPISLIYCGGNEIPYTMLFMNGREKDFFLLLNEYKMERINFKDFDIFLNGENLSVEMNNIVCNNSTHVLFEMMDGRLYLFNINQGLFKPFRIPIRMNLGLVYANIMSRSILYQLGNDNVLVIHNTTKSDILEIEIEEKSPLKLLSGYVNGLSLFIAENNKLYGYTRTKAYGFPSLSYDTVTYIETPFEKASHVKSIQCGAYFVLILLDNGQVFGRGMNTQYQICLTHANTYCEFIQIDFGCCINSISCSSSCSILETDRAFIFLGELTSCFQSNSDRENISYIVKKEKIPLKLRQNGFHKTQQVACGPFHCFIYFRKQSFTTGYELRFLWCNLKSLVASSKLSDIGIIPSLNI